MQSMSANTIRRLYYVLYMFFVDGNRLCFSRILD